MCDQKDLALTGALGNTFGAINQAVGAYSEAKSQRNAITYAANAADINAQISELTAQSALQQGERQYQRSRLQTAQLKGTQRASMAANGIDLGEGSPLNVLTTTDVLGEVDANTIQADAIRSAWSYRTQATNYRNEALFKRAASQSINPGLKATTSLLGNAGSVADKWYRYKKEF